MGFAKSLINIPGVASHAYDNIDFIKGVCLAVVDENGLKSENVEFELKALDDLRGEWDGLLEKSKTSIDKDFEVIEAIKENFINDKNLSIDKLKTELLKHREDFEGLKQAYDEDMQIKAPVDYWEKKKNYHHNEIVVLTRASIITGFFGGLSLIWGTFALLKDEEMTVTNYWKLGLLALSLTLFFWLMRLLVKILLSHIHLKSDAHERVVMTKTYLSLLRDKSGFDDSDKKLILSTLFRPSNSGLIKDDGLPPGIYDILTKAVSK